MEHSSSVTLSGFCEHIVSKTQSEVYRLSGTAVRECPEYDNMEYIMDAACKEAHEECMAALAEE